MAIATLSVDLVAKVAQFEKDLKRGASAAERSAADIASAFNIARGAAAGLFGALSIDAFTQFVRSTINGVDKLNDLADATGASVENLSALEDVAARTGTSMDTVGDAVVKLNKSLASAQGDNEMARAFRALGLSVADLKKEDPALALQRVAVALAGYADDGAKARLVQDLFGKSIKEVAPLLNDLARAGKLVATVTSDQAREAEKFNQELAKMSKNAADAGRGIVGQFLPGLNQALQVLEQLRKGPGFAAALAEVFKGNAAGSAQEGLDSYNAKIREIDAQIQRLAKTAADPRYSIAESAKRRVEELQAQRDELAKFADAYRTALNFDGAGAGRGSGAPVADKPTVGDFKVDPDVEKAQKAYLKLAESIGAAAEAAAEEIVSGEKLTEVQKLRAKVLQELNDGQTKFTDSQKASILAGLEGLSSLDRDLKLRRLQADVLKHSRDLIAQQVAALDRETDARLQTNEQLRQQVEEFGKTTEAIEALRIARLEDVAAQEDSALIALRNIEGTEQEAAAREKNLDALKRQIDLRKRLLAEEVRAQTDAAGGAQKALDEYLNNVAKTGDATRDAVSRSISSLEDNLTSSLAKGELSVRSFIDTVLQEVIRLTVVKPLLADIFSGGGIGGGLSSLLGSASSNLGGEGFSGFFAKGGYVPPGKWGILGERGPEPVFGGKTGATVLPSSAAVAAKAGDTYQVIVQGDATPATVRLINNALAQFEARLNRARV